MEWLRVRVSRSNPEMKIRMQGGYLEGVAPEDGLEMEEAGQALARIQAGRITTASSSHAGAGVEVTSQLSRPEVRG